MPAQAETDVEAREFPLAPEQSALLFVHRMTPSGRPDLMNLPSAVRIDGPVDLAALHKTVAQICMDNDALRTRLVMVADEPRQAVLPEVSELQIIDDFKDLPVRDIEGARRHLSDFVWRKFDPENESPIRSFLLSFSDREHVFGFVTNHLVSDATSHAIILKQFREWYKHFAFQAPAPKPVKRRSYREFVLERIRWEENEGPKELPYWKSIVEGLRPFGSDPNLRPSPTVPYYVQALPKDELAKFRQFARDHRVGFFVILLALSFCFLFRRTNEQKVGLLVSRDGRKHPAYFNTVGQCSLACPLTADRPSGATLAEFVKQIWKTWAGAMSRPWVSAQMFGRDLASLPLFVAYLEADVLGSADNTEQTLRLSKFPLMPAPNHRAQGFIPTIFFSNTADGLELCILQPPPELQRFETDDIAKAFTAMLEGFIASSELPFEEFVAGL